MFPYYMLVILPILGSLIRSNGIIIIGNDRGKERNGIVMAWFFLLFMGLLMFRDASCGSDTGGYILTFQSVKDQRWSEQFRFGGSEIGYRLICKAVSMFAADPQFILIATGFLSVYPLWKFYREEAEDPVLTIILFLVIAPFSMYFSGVRQVLAMTFAFPLWRCAREKKWLRFVIIVLLAMQFHRSAFVLLAIYPVYHLKITSKWILPCTVFIVLVYLNNRVIFNWLSQFLWKDYSAANETGAYTVLLLLVLFAVYSFILVDEEKMDAELVAYRNILLLAVTIQCFTPVHTLAMRMNYYFLPFIPILIPKIANRSKIQFAQIAGISKMVMMLFFVLYFFVRAHTGSDTLRIYPYIPFWKG